MPNRVEGKNEISINGVRYRTSGPVRRFLASQPAPRMVVGEPGPRAHQNKSAVFWTDWRGGIGIQRMDPAKDINRAWWSTCNLSQARHLTLGALTTTTAASGVTGSWTVGFINEWDNTIYAGFGTSVRSYNNTTDAWSANLRTLPSAATDSLNIRLGGVEYLVVAYDTGYDYFNGTTWATSTRDARYLAFWDDRLWGIDSTGLLWSTGTLGTPEEDDAQLPLPNASITNLFLAREPSGDIVLHAATNRGIYTHDADAQRFALTSPQFPKHPDGGLGADSWRDDAYISAGLTVYKKITSSQGAVITTVGPDRDHGLPAAYRGKIAALIPTHNALIALLDATSGGATTLTPHQAGTFNNADVVQPDSGRSAVLARDEFGWQVLWTSAADTLPITTGHVSNAYSTYRLWWGQNQRVYWQTLPRDIINPAEVTNKTYALAATHETPWFDADETHGDKTSIVLCVDTTRMSATETAIISYRLNMDDTVANQTPFATITASGHTEFLFPNATTPNGTLFFQIKFVVDLARGTTNTNTPDVNRLDFYFIRQEDTRWGAAVTIHIPKGGDFGQSPEQMYDNIVTMADLRTLGEVTWRARDANDAGTANPYNYYMKLVQFTGVEETGHDFSAEYQVVLTQV